MGLGFNTTFSQIELEMTRWIWASHKKNRVWYNYFNKLIIKCYKRLWKNKGIHSKDFFQCLNLLHNQVRIMIKRKRKKKHLRNVSAFNRLILIWRNQRHQIGLEEAVDIFLNNLIKKNFITSLCGMVTVPKHIFCIIWTCPTEFVAQYYHFYNPCATTPSICYFKPWNHSKISLYNTDETKRDVGDININKWFKSRWMSWVHFSSTQLNRGISMSLIKYNRHFINKTFPKNLTN